MRVLHNLEPLADEVSGVFPPTRIGRIFSFVGPRIHGKVVAGVLVGQPAADPELDDDAEERLRHIRAE